MSLNVISLNDMLKSITTNDIQKLLLSFTSIKTQDSSGADDVETFLHSKAIEFERMDLSRTYLVMSTFSSRPILVGYFSISNKPLTIPKRQFQHLSNSLKKRLMGFGHKTEQQTYVIKGYLLGQLGKNFSDEARLANCCNGRDLLKLAYQKVEEAYHLVGGRILYLECENIEKIINFYTDNGFSRIEEFESENGYCMMVKQLRDILGQAPT